MESMTHRLSQLGLTPKLVLLLVIFAVVPMGIVAYIGFDASHDIEATTGARFQVAAENIADKIDRNLFGRYGDVQAFGKNRIVSERYNWYTPGANDNEIVRTMNEYVETYGIYSLTIMVDPNGDVIAVNDKDAKGNQVDTTFLYKKNYKHTEWFQALVNETYTTRMPFTAPGNDTSTGTFIEDIHIDEDVKGSYPGEDGLTLSFSAPVYQDGDVNGDVIAYWTNRTKFSLIEEIVQQAYKELQGSGYPNAEITLLDKSGNIIVDYDPGRHGKEEVVHDLEHVILKFNLAEKGLNVAQEAVAGKTGYMQSYHARKQIEQIGGYTHFKGALGYPGMNWSVLVRVPVEEAFAQASSIQRKLMIAVLICSALVFPIGILMGRQVVSRLKPVMDIAERASHGDLSHRVPVTTSDELGQMGVAFNGFLDQLNGMLNQITEVVQTVAASAEQLSANGGQVAQASREQSSQATQVATAVDEMSATAGEMAQNAQVLAGTAQEVNQSAVQGGENCCRFYSRDADGDGNHAGFC